MTCTVRWWLACPPLNPTARQERPSLSDGRFRHQFSSRTPSLPSSDPRLRQLFAPTQLPFDSDGRPAHGSLGSVLTLGPHSALSGCTFEPICFHMVVSYLTTICSLMSKALNVKSPSPGEMQLSSLLRTRAYPSLPGKRISDFPLGCVREKVLFHRPDIGRIHVLTIECGDTPSALRKKRGINKIRNTRHTLHAKNGGPTRSDHGSCRPRTRCQVGK